MSDLAMIFTDSSGRQLSREAVEVLARQNMRASSEPDTTAEDSDAELLQWATDADGDFSDDQVALYGFEYLRQ